jgi:hypothetical protein
LLYLQNHFSHDIHLIVLGIRDASSGLGTPAVEQVWCTYRAGTAPPPQRQDLPWPSYKCPCTLIPVRIPDPAKHKIITELRPRAREARCRHGCGTWALLAGLADFPGCDAHWLRRSARRFGATNSFRILCDGSCSAQVELNHNWASRVFCSEQNTGFGN